MFFEASSIGCRRTTYDVKKVTYNMYSCDTCCISREMMETDGRGCAKCQNPRVGHGWHFEIVNDNRTKEQIVSSSSFEIQSQKREGGGGKTKFLQ